MVPADSHRISRVLWYSGSALGVRQPFAYGAITRYRRPFQTVRLDCGFVTPPRGGDPGTCTPTTPAAQRSPAITYSRFGLFPFRSPLLRESRLISFPGGTEMVHFPPFASASYVFRVRMTRHYPRRVSPFGNPRIEACLRLPGAYRSLLRPSSPTCAKASTACPL